MDIFLGVLFLIVCFLLIVVILLQKGRGGGLSAAFGGMGQSAFGTKTGDVFTWVTIVLTSLFLLLAVGSSLVFRPRAGDVIKPMFQPPPGPINETTQIIIYTPTEGATIRWTNNGSTPDDSSAVYERPVRVSPGTTLKARAYRTGWQTSEVAVGAYLKADGNQLPKLPGVNMPEAPTSGPAMRGAPTTSAAGAPASAPAGK
jgi:preprotein translocase subunit SecG